MAEFKCKNCGGILVPTLEDPSRGVCDSCFCPGIIPSITDERRADAHNRGIDFRRARKFDDALAEFAGIVKENPKDAEAHWDMMLCRYGINYEKDYRSGEYIPTCDRLSDVSVYSDPDYKAALEYAKLSLREYYKEQADHIEKIRLGMIALAAKAEAYDVFICFKDTDDRTGRRTEDSHTAHEIYMELTNKGYKVFFSRVTLKEEHLGEEWEPVIYAALNTAKLMLVVGCSRDNIEAPWVKNEWTRYLAVRAKDKTKSIITCYDGKRMKVEDIPPELGALEAIDFRESTFYKYILQTVFAHCNKSTPKVSAAQQKSAGNYVKRAFQFLEDGNWDKADKMLEEALDLDPENGDAHLGKLLLDRKCRSVERLNNESTPISRSGHYSRAVKYATIERRNQLQAIDQMITKRLEEQRREKDYNSMVSKFDSLSTASEATDFAAKFRKMGDYKDAATYAQSCETKAKLFREQAEREAEEARAREEAEAKRRAEEVAAEARRKEEELEAQRKEQERQRKKAKRVKIRKRIRRIVFWAIVALLLVYQFYGKNYIAATEAYTLAEQYAENGDYKNATMQYFVAAKVNYQDSEAKAYEYCEKWLGWEPVVLTTDEYPWWSVDNAGGLQLDYDKYDSSVEFALPAILDGELVSGIGEGCFEGNDGLKSLNLPANYTWIGDRAFAECYNLGSITMQGVEVVGYSAFYDCDSLTTVVLPESCRSISPNAFEDCDYLNNVTLNAGLVEINEAAFRYCSSLTAVNIPATVETIGYEAFAYTSLVTLTFEEGAGGIGERAFAECDYLSAVSVPGSVASVGDGAFFACDALASATFGAGVESIGVNAFDDCYMLSSVTFGEGLLSIGDYAFDDCGITGNLYIPDGITYIGIEAFNNCGSLYEVYVGNTSGLTVGASCFYGCSSLNGAYFGEGLVSLGDSAFDYCEAMTWVTLPEGLTSIGNWCFSNDALYEILIPSTVTTIGEGAFNNCNNLKGAYIPGGVSVIEASTFAYCDSLWWLWFDEGISIIRDDAVYDSNNITTVCYSGSAEAWNAVSKGNNSQIINAVLYPNYTAQ